MKFIIRLIVMLVSLLMLTFTTACSGDTDHPRRSPCCSSTAAGPLSFVVGVHQGGLAPGLPAAAIPLLQQTVTANQPISMVTVDGTPAKVPLQVPVVPTTAAGIEIKVATAKAVNTISAAIAGAQADSDHADLLDAISLAADTLPPLRSLGDDSRGVRGTVMVIDNGISDRGALATTVSGLLTESTEPNQVADYVADHTTIDLTGITVVLVGLADTTAPQQPLSATEKQVLARLWTRVLSRLHAKVVVNRNPRDTTTPPDTTHRTATAPVRGERPFSPPAAGTTTTTVLDATQIGFASNSNQLTDPAEAEAAVADIAVWLNTNPHRRVDIYGTTSSDGNPDGRRIRSQGRAQTVRRLLLAAGVAPIQIGRVEGLGMDFPGYTPDRNRDGTLNPVTATKNRTTRFVLHAESGHGSSAGAQGSDR